MIERIAGDTRYAFRTLAKAPTFSLAAISTIALAVGATTAIFALVHHILLRPLPFPGSERVLALCETNAATPAGWCGASPMNVADWSREARALESAGVARTESFVAQSDSGGYGVMGAIATPGFFDVLQVKPALGRALEERDLARGSNQVVLVSHRFWVERLGSDPHAVGRAITMDRAPFVVVGVLPAAAWLPDPFADVQAWKPLTASIDNVDNRGWRGFTALGRLRPGVTAQQLVSELDVIRARLAAAYPQDNKDWGFRAVPLRERIVGEFTGTLWTFLGMAALVLLIASANVAGLLLVRTAGRAGELAVRASLGAGRRRLVQQLMTESVVLAVAGGAAGLLLAVWVTAAFVTVAPPGIPRLAEVAIDLRVAAFALALACAIALLFGLAPARRAWKTDVNGTLKGLRSGGTDTRLRSAFAAAQLALALMLLVGAGLLARSFMRFLDWDPGFNRASVVTAWMLPPKAGPGQSAVDLMERVRDEVAAVPGIESVALASAGPLFGGEETDGIAVAGRAPYPADRMPRVHWFDVDPHYFETLGMAIVRGRGFTAADRFGAPAVAIVNDAFARAIFPGEDPIGRRVTAQEHPAEIVGVIPDVAPLRPDQQAPPQIYWPIQQYRRGAAYLVMRTRPGIAGVREAVQARVAAVDRDIQLNAFVTLDERFARQIVSPRFNMLLVAAFALVAVILAAVGVYGVIAYGVASRTREFAVRLALGSTPGELVGGVVRAGMKLAGAGILAGAAAALALGRLLTTMLYGLSPADPLTLAAATALLALIALAATWVPARRASRIDPARALRAD